MPGNPTPGAVAPRLTDPPADRWFRTRPDSSVLDRPRLLARLLIDLDELDDRIALYERLQGVPADLRMPIPDFGGLELAAVGGVLLIASERRFTPVQRRTAYSLIVPSLAAQLGLLAPTGTTVVEPTEEIVPGRRARVRYPDGSLAELVEHRPRSGELPAPRPGIAVRETAGTGVRLLARRAVPADRLEEAVRFYTTALGTTAHRDGDAPSAVVGNLLLAGTDGPDDPPVAFALRAPSVETVTRLAGSGRTAARGPGGRPVVTLADGARAEVWEGSPRPAAPGEDGA
ncbi:lactoylglutathione lyase [Streptomyces luteireticuli]|uniref:lactoylglutathione lyase n=1 Tax=Streptomyces luteireticuli TaxID=173858 RepID=UPI0035577057